MYLTGDVKGQIVKVIQQTVEQYKVEEKFCCRAIQLRHERYTRWMNRHKETGRYGGGKPGPKVAPHALLEEDRQKIVEMAKEEGYADLSHRQLSVVASEEGIVEVSPSTVYRELKKAGLQCGSNIKRAHRSQEKPEVKAERPNQVWSWDLTYIALGPIFVYLFAIIDVYSRKIVGWHLSLNATAASTKKAWDNALSNEGLIGVTGAPSLPLALSDHGIQMAKKTAKEFFRDLGIKQLFARYQTPEDNAWIESWFRILKCDWLKFKDYVSFEQLRTILAAFIEYYNNERYHGSIGYVTPSQMHGGEAERVLEERRKRKEEARRRRFEVNRNLKTQEQLRKAA